MPYRRYERRRSATVFGIRPETALFSSEERNNLSEFFLTWECVPPEICTVVRLQRNVCPVQKDCLLRRPRPAVSDRGSRGGASSSGVCRRMVSPAGETRADAAGHRLSDRMGNRLPLHGPFAGARAPIRRQTLRRRCGSCNWPSDFLWSVFFFYLRSPLAGFVDILLLDALVIVYICRVRHRTPSAAWLFAPYVLWILFATYLNGYILVKNPDNKIVTQNVLTTNIDTLSNSKNRQTMKHMLPLSFPIKWKRSRRR